MNPERFTRRAMEAVVEAHGQATRANAPELYAEQVLVVLVEVPGVVTEVLAKMERDAPHCHQALRSA